MLQLHVLGVQKSVLPFLRVVNFKLPSAGFCIVAVERRTRSDP